VATVIHTDPSANKFLCKIQYIHDKKGIIFFISEVNVSVKLYWFFS